MKRTKGTSAADLSPTDVVIEARRNNTASNPEASALSKPTFSYCELQPNDVVLPDVAGTNNHEGNVFYRTAVYQTAVRLQVLCKDKEAVLPSYQTAAERLLRILRKDRKARILLYKNNQYIEYPSEKAVPLILEDMLQIRKHDLRLGTSKQPIVVGKKKNNKEDDTETTRTTAASSSSCDTATSSEVMHHAQQQPHHPSDFPLPSTPAAPATSHLHSDLSTLSPRHQYALQLIQKLTNAWHRQRNTAQQQQRQSLSVLINTIWADELLSAEETLEQSRIRWQLRQRYVALAAGSRLQDITRRLLQHWNLSEDVIVGLATPPPAPQQQQPVKQATARLQVNFSNTTAHHHHHHHPRPATKSVAHKATRSSAKHSNSSSNNKKQQQQQHCPPPSCMARSRRHHNAGPLSAEEKAQLWKGILLHGISNWSVIAEQCVPTRSRQQLGSFGQRLKDMSLEQVQAYLLGTTTKVNETAAAAGGGRSE